jgi:hypothetical protein
MLVLSPSVIGICTPSIELIARADVPWPEAPIFRPTRSIIASGSVIPVRTTATWQVSKYGLLNL